MLFRLFAILFRILIGVILLLLGIMREDAFFLKIGLNRVVFNVS